MKTSMIFCKCIKVAASIIALELGALPWRWTTAEESKELLELDVFPPDYMVVTEDKDIQFYPSLTFLTSLALTGGSSSREDGTADYIKLLNERDGGINGVKLMIEECDVSYDVALGRECYKRMKHRGSTGAPMFSPYSTPITYTLTKQATIDKIPVISVGYGRPDAGDGRVFPYVFTVPVTYWSTATAIIKYIGHEEGSLESLRGKKITFLYHDSVYGREPIPILKKLATIYGYQLNILPVPPDRMELKAVWQQINHQIIPDWILFWGLGKTSSVVLNEAGMSGYPLSRIIGSWWAFSEPDMLLAGKEMKGYKTATFHAPGTDFPVHHDIWTYLYERGIGTSEKPENINVMMYNRGLINAFITTEAIRMAQTRYGHKPLTGEQVRWGFEHLDLTEELLGKRGFNGLIEQFRLSCEDHEGNGSIRIQQWDGTQWQLVSGRIKPMRDIVRPMIEATAARYANENGIIPRDCVKEK